MKRERKEKTQGQQEEGLLVKQLLQLQRIRKVKRQGQQGEPEGLLEKQLLQSLRIDHRGERKQPLGPQKLRL